MTAAVVPDTKPCTMHILDHTGDSVITWHKDNEAEVAVAKAAFEAAIEKRAGVFKIGKRGARERIYKFDKNAEDIKIIASPQMLGG